MTRRAEQIPLEDDWVLTKVWSKRQSAPAILAAIQAVPRDDAFIPALSAGPAFDSPELTYAGVRIVENPMMESDQMCVVYPPPCDGFTHAGEVLAHAQHSAATEGDDCSSGVCLMTRGAND